MAFFPYLTDFGLEMGKIGLLDQFSDQITWRLFWLFSPTLQAVRSIFCRNLTGFFSDFSGGSNPLWVLFFAPWSQIIWPKICAIFIKRQFCPTSPPKNLGSRWTAESKKPGAISGQPDLPNSSSHQKKVYKKFRKILLAVTTMKTRLDSLLSKTSRWWWHDHR